MPSTPSNILPPKPVSSTPSEKEKGRKGLKSLASVVIIAELSNLYYSWRNGTSFDEIIPEWLNGLFPVGSLTFLMIVAFIYGITINLFPLSIWYERRTLALQTGRLLFVLTLFSAYILMTNAFYAWRESSSFFEQSQLIQFIFNGVPATFFVIIACSIYLIFYSKPRSAERKKKAEKIKSSLSR